VTSALLILRGGCDIFPDGGGRLSPSLANSCQRHCVKRKKEKAPLPPSLQRRSAPHPIQLYLPAS